ncbi:MAG: glycosyltransferase family 2 protein [Planctomycetales bacterium]|nr:glycosyltransferase family 2 protein [Planctomycetales bacterium]
MSPAAGPETGRGVTAVVPAYNEVRLAEESLRRLRAALPDAEIVVVDDASTDGTGALLDRLAGDMRLRVSHHPENRGKGAALRTGFAAATGAFVLVHDADLEYDPKDLPAVLAPLRQGSADVVYGSRFRGDRARPLSLLHSLGNRFLTFASNLVTGLSLTDMETCYKAFRAETLRGFRLTEDRFGFEPEVTVRVADSGARVAEVPIGYHARTWAEGKKIGPRDVVRALLVLARHGLRGRRAWRAWVAAALLVLAAGSAAALVLWRVAG